MSMLAMDDDGDLAIGNNKFSIVSGKSEIRQRIIQNLRTFLGEWFLDNTIGVPWFQLVFEKSTSRNVIEAAIKDAILATEGVIALEEWTPLDLDVGTRELTVEFKVKTEDEDELQIVEVLP